MKNYIEVGYNGVPHLTPDNFLGRFGAEVYNHTDDGFGGVLIGTFGSFIFGAIGYASVTGILSGELISLIWGLIGIATTLPIFIMCLLTIFSLAYVKINRVSIGPEYDRYGYPTFSDNNDLKKIAEASETYRGMSLNDQKKFGPLINKMRMLANEGDFTAACKRADKFNETRAILDEMMKSNKTVDNSDLEEMDALIHGMQEVRAQRKALDKHEWAG